MEQWALVRRSRSSRWPGIVALVAILCRAAVHASEPGDEASAAAAAAEDGSWEERIAVVAEAGGVAPPLGSSSTTLDPTELSGNTSTLTQALTEVAGVAENGQGGHFQVFSIRGISRHRVLRLVSGMRVHSERRAGASVSFVDPLLLGSVSVLRGPATALHGSGALGGVVQVFPRSFEGWSLRAGYDSQGDENYQVLGYGDARWSVGFARRDAGDAEAPDGTRLNSQFTQYSATIRRLWEQGPRRYELLFVPTLGEDIGKANKDFPDRTTNYPRERHQMLKFSAESETGWRVRAHVHGHDLETEVVEGASRSRVQNDSLDYGMRWEHERGVVRVRQDVGRRPSDRNRWLCDGALGAGQNRRRERCAGDVVAATKRRRPGRRGFRTERVCRNRAACRRARGTARQPQHRPPFPEPVRAVLQRHHGSGGDHRQSEPRSRALAEHRGVHTLARAEAAGQRGTVPQRDRRLHRARGGRTGPIDLRKPVLGNAARGSSDRPGAGQ